MRTTLQVEAAVDSGGSALDSLNSLFDSFVARLPYIGLALVVYLAFHLLGLGVRKLMRRLAWQRRRRNLGLVLGRLAQGIIWLIGLLVAAVIAFPGFTPGQLIQVLGLSSVAIGFAFRDILQNYLAGILILLTEPFRIDDQIVFADYEGTVEEIQTRATSIRTYDGRRVVIPNADLYTKPVTVNTAFPARRLQYDIGISYDDDIERARRLILDQLRSLPSVLPEPGPQVFVVALAESTVDLRLLWWVRPPRRFETLEAQDEVLARVKAKLLEAGVELPFPTQQILLNSDPDGSRHPRRPDGME